MEGQIRSQQDAIQQVAEHIRAKQIAYKGDSAERLVVEPQRQTSKSEVNMVAAQIGQLRQRRAEPDDSQIGDLVKQQKKTVKRAHKKCSRCSAAWQQFVAAALPFRTTLVSLSKDGVLTVLVESSSALYEVDRHLRAGALDAMRRESGAAVQEVRLKIGRESPATDRREPPPHVYALLEDDRPFRDSDLYFDTDPAFDDLESDRDTAAFR